MKKLFLFVVLLGGVFALASCEAATFEIAMITDAGDIDDKSFNQGTWEGIEAFAEENELSSKYYRPTEVSNSAYVAAIDLAVSGGAQVIVTPGFLFENAIHEAQSKYPEVKFVLIDGSPHNVTNWDTMATYDGEAPDFTIADNTLSIFFQEEQSGFLAGYAAVKEGLTDLGFMGGLAVPAVVRFGMGFVAGAYYAAEEVGAMTWEFNPSYYEYLGTFDPSDEVKTKATTWYQTIEAIHVAAGGAGTSVMLAAEETSKTVIGVDVDQSNLSDTVITSAMKGLAAAVQSALTDYLADEFDGGVSVTLGASDDAVGLPAGDSFRFDTFTTAEYDAVLALLVNGTIDVPSDHTSTAELEAFIEDLGFTVSQALLDAVVPPPAG